MRASSALLAVAFALFAVVPGSVRAQDAAWLGAKVETVTAETMAAKGLSMPFGALVTQVRKRSPAAKSGLKVGDVIVSVNGKAVTDAAVFEATIAKLAVGATAKIVRIRGKQAPSTLKVTHSQKPWPKARGQKAAVVPPKPVGPPPILMLDTGGCAMAKT
jgi:S1-C subfamily serine protease